MWALTDRTVPNVIGCLEFVPAENPKCHWYEHRWRSCGETWRNNRTLPPVQFMLWKNVHLHPADSTVEEKEDLQASTAKFNCRQDALSIEDNNKKRIVQVCFVYIYWKLEKISWKPSQSRRCQTLYSIRMLIKWTTRNMQKIGGTFKFLQEVPLDQSKMKMNVKSGFPRKVMGAFFKMLCSSSNAGQNILQVLKLSIRDFLSASNFSFVKQT